MSAARWRITARPSFGAGAPDTAPIADTTRRARDAASTLPTAAAASISSSATKAAVGKAVPLDVAKPTSRRDGYLYVPATYDPSRPSPLVVMLHGVSTGLRLGAGHVVNVM